MSQIDEFLIRSCTPTIENWPDTGLWYKDIAPLFANPRATRMITDALVQRYLDWDITHIAALDGFGCLLGSNLAYALNKPLLMIRKNGEQRAPVERLDYTHGTLTDTYDIASGSLSFGNRVLLVDDVIGRGDSMLAATQLIKRCEASVAEAVSILSLMHLGGTQRLNEANIANYSLLLMDEP